MRILIVYYSYDGNTAFIAEQIAEELKSDVLVLQPVEEKRRKGIMKYVWNGRAALMHTKPEITPLSLNPLDYDLIFLGTPVWAGTWAPVFNTFFEMVNLQGKRVACFCCHAGGGAGVQKHFRRQLSYSSVLGFSDYLDPLLSKTKDKQAEGARLWARDMVERAKTEQR